MSGNKGAVAIRLQFCDTSFCFVTAHLAAGQLNYEERNSDYRTITHGLHFQRGRTIDSHEQVSNIISENNNLLIWAQQRNMACRHELPRRFGQ